MEEKWIEDLLFVKNKYNLQEIEKTFKEKYKQTTPKISIQNEFKEKTLLNAEFLTREETFNKYHIQEEILFEVHKKLEEKAKKSGIDIQYIDMAWFSEDDFYENKDIHTDKEHKKHAETARSDGEVLLLEKNLSNAGGIQGRIYDLMHLAFGHMIQWSNTDTHLLLNKEEAWSIGYRNHEDSPKAVIDMMSHYEFEAGMLGVEALHQVLDTMDIDNNQKNNILQYFVDYAYCDRSYIIQHYRGNYKSFQTFWNFGRDIPPRQDLPFVTKFIKRHAVEIGLIQDNHSIKKLPNTYEL